MGIQERTVAKIKALRSQKGLTQEQVAELADISYKHFQAIEGGKKSDIKISTLEKIAKAFDLEPWELLRD